HCLNDSCVGAFPKDCTDGNACTTDLCSSTQGCQNPGIIGCCNTDAACADTNACTTNEHCDLTTHACAHDPVTCDDQNPCTVDICASFGGQGCVYTPCTQVPNPPSCPQQCFPPPTCGNGHLDPGETCDPPDPTLIPGTNQPKCRPDCTFCGDSVVQDGEVC